MGNTEAAPAFTPSRGVVAGMFATFGSCLRRGRLIGFVHVCVHVGTIYAHHSHANILATDVAVRGRLLRV